MPLLPLALAVLLSIPAAAAIPGQTALEAALREAAHASCPSLTFAVDPDLTRAAREFVAAAQAGRSPISGAALGFYAALESYEPSPVSGIAKVAPPSNADRAVGDLFGGQCRFNRAGVAAATLAGNEAIVALVTAAHATDLAPIPGTARPGDAVEVDAQLGPGLSAPRLFVLAPGAKAEEHPASVDGRRLRATVRLQIRGEYSLEVLATGPGGPEVAAIRRIFVGVAPPQSPPAEKPRQERGLSGVEHTIAQLRGAHGLPPLQRDSALDRVAEGHSREMARARTFAHVLPADGSMTDRLRKAGYAYRSAGENIGLSIDPLAAHEAIASSPAHLANLLDPNHRRLGLGIATGTSPDGAEGTYLTEVLAAPLEESRDPEGEVARLLQQKRHALGLKPLARDARLDAIATREVRALVSRGELSRDDGQAVVEEALRAAPGLRSAVAEAFIGSGASATGKSPNASSPAWTRVGVGAVYASSEAYGTGRLWVVLLYAR